jgi:hypothetical protein
MDYVNYHGKLLLQPQNTRYFVVYTGSGTHIAVAVVDTQRLPDLHSGETRIPAKGFVVDYTTYWLATNDVNEAYYLVTILNSDALDLKIKQYQSRGKWGPRHICRLPFEINLPAFDSQNALHKQIAALGAKATNEASSIPKMSRLQMKSAIPSMKEIDKLVSELFGK